MRRLINTVKLRFFQDEANGVWGLAHEDTYNDQYNGQNFNAFWSGIGMFHDVFEHYFEHQHKYFRGEAAMNVGGEMAAMGHMWYYVMEFGLGIRDTQRGMGYRPIEESIMNVTKSEVEEAIKSGYCNYGATLESRVPPQKPLKDNDFLEQKIREYYEEVRQWKFSESPTSSYDYASEREDSETYRRSVCFSKIANLHRWGYRQAEKLVPDTYSNLSQLHKFITFWEEFTQNHKAEELSQAYTGLSIKIYKEKDEVSWRGFVKGIQGVSVDTEVVHVDQFTY
jgi:hypothetical protein